MEVEESLLGFMATIALLSIYESKSTYDIGIWVNSTGFFFWEIPSLDGVLVGLRGGVWSWMCSGWILWPI